MRSGAGSGSGSGWTSAIEPMLIGLSIPRFRHRMRNMSVLELLFALLLVCLGVGIGFVIFLAWNLVRRAEGQARDVAELKARLQSRREPVSVFRLSRSSMPLTLAWTLPGALI